MSCKVDSDWNLRPVWHMRTPRCNTPHVPTVRISPEVGPCRRRVARIPVPTARRAPPSAARYAIGRMVQTGCSGHTVWYRKGYCVAAGPPLLKIPAVRIITVDRQSRSGAAVPAHMNDVDTLDHLTGKGVCLQFCRISISCKVDSDWNLRPVWWTAYLTERAARRTRCAVRERMPASNAPGCWRNGEWL
jgi:hypothetical protein